jgi:hypothetical protein
MQRIGRMACRMGNRNRDSIEERIKSCEMKKTVKKNFLFDLKDVSFSTSSLTSRALIYQSYVSMSEKRKSDERALNNPGSIV